MSLVSIISHTLYPYLVVVLWWRHREVEHAGWYIHAGCSHCSISVSSDVAQMVMGSVVVFKEGNCVRDVKSIAHLWLPINLFMKI